MWSVCVLGSSKHYCLSFVCSCRRDTPLASFVFHRSLSTIAVLLLFCSAKIKQNRSFYLDDRTFVVCIQHHVVLLLSLKRGPHLCVWLHRKALTELCHLYFVCNCSHSWVLHADASRSTHTLCHGRKVLSMLRHIHTDPDIQMHTHLFSKLFRRRTQRNYTCSDFFMFVCVYCMNIFEEFQCFTCDHIKFYRYYSYHSPYRDVYFL